MKSIKKLTALALAGAMTMGLLLTGCSSSNGAEGGSESADSKGAAAEVSEEAAGGKVIIFQSKTEIVQQLIDCAEAFQEETGIEVEVWETSGDSYYTDLKTGMSTQSGPTLFSLQPGAESKEMKDYLEDIGDLSFVSSVSKGMADEIDGKTVGIPYTLEGFGFVYNKSLTDAAAFTGTDDIVAYLEKAKGEGINGLGLSQEDYFLIMHILNTPFALQADPDAFLQQVFSGEVRLADVAEFKEFAVLMDAIKANCTNPVDITYDNNCGDFATGKTAMIHQGNWCTSMFTDYDVDFEMSIAAVPVAGNNKLSVSVPTAWYINVDAEAADKAAAKTFLEWLYTSETGKDYLMNQFGFVPVVEGMKSENLDALSQAVADAAASGNTIPWALTEWPAGIASDLSPVVKEFFTSDMSAEDMINKLNDVFVEAGK